MKTTVEIPDELFREPKATVDRNGTKLKDMVAEGLRRVVGEATPTRRRVKFPFIPARAALAWRI